MKHVSYNIFWRRSGNVNKFQVRVRSTLNFSGDASPHLQYVRMYCKIQSIWYQTVKKVVAKKIQIRAKQFDFAVSIIRILRGHLNLGIESLLSIDDVPSTFYLTHRWTRSRLFRMNSCCSFPMSGTNVIEKFPITYRRRNFPGGRNLFLGISPRGCLVSMVFCSLQFSILQLDIGSKNTHNSSIPTASNIFYIIENRYHIEPLILLDTRFVVIQ